jgi:methionine-rich copper-binding protein CopC
LTAGIIALVLTGLSPSGALAHAELDRSSPASDAVIPAAPKRVEIWFTQELFRREGANTIVVEGPSGRVDDGNVELDDADRTHLGVGLSPGLPAGEYRVSWTSLSAIDGDAAEGAFVFSVDPAALTSTPASVAETSDTAGTEPAGQQARGSGSVGGGGVPLWVLITIVALGGSAALSVWAVASSPPGAR